jgi:hypothetical protein
MAYIDTCFSSNIISLNIFVVFIDLMPPFLLVKNAYLGVMNRFWAKQDG